MVAKRATSENAVFIWLICAFENVLLLPIALVIFLREGNPLSLADWGLIAGSSLIHLVYFMLLTNGYQRGDLSIVYPLARGVGPLLVTVGAVIFLAERPTPLAIAATLLIAAGMFILTGDPTKLRESNVLSGVIFGLLTALSVAAYSVWDAYAVSRMDIMPFVFQWGIGLGRLLLLTPYALTHRESVRAAWQQDRGKAVVVSIFSPGAYILILTALTFSPVSYVAPMRSISILIGVWIGTRLLGEANTRRRMIASGIMVAGVVMMGLA